MIFKTLNQTIEKSSYTINIKNIDYANGHWYSEKNILNYLGKIEDISYDKENFEKNLIILVIQILKENQRIQESIFYKVNNTNKIVFFVVSKTINFSNAETFSKEITIDLKKNNLCFSIIEINEDEYKEINEDKKKIPDNWSLIEQLNKKLNKLKFFSDFS